MSQSSTADVKGPDRWARLRSVFHYGLIILSGLLWLVPDRFSQGLCALISGLALGEWLISLVFKRHFFLVSCVLVLFLIAVRILFGEAFSP